MQDIVTMLTTLISNVGFPIACCIVLFKQNSEMTKKLAENTSAINRLSDILERDSR